MKLLFFLLENYIYFFVFFFMIMNHGLDYRFLDESFIEGVELMVLNFGFDERGINRDIYIYILIIIIDIIIITTITLIIITIN